MTTRLTGVAAIEAAERMGLRLGKYEDPTQGAREGLTVKEARAVAAEDPSLVYVDVPTGTTTDNVTKAQIEQLRDEAASAGDSEQVRLCEVALRVWSPLAPRDSSAASWEISSALRKCVRAIQAAEAMV